MTQNIYDDKEFFEGYSRLHRSIEGLDGAPEWPSLRALIPDLRSRNVLDLGCGYGVMGLYAAKLVDPQRVYMLDNDPEAVRVATENARANGVPGVHVDLSDGFNHLRETGFTKILCNPPFHADFAVAKHFIEKGFNRLIVGGQMWMVTKRDKWYRNKLTRVFGGARVVSRDAYFVFHSVKKANTYAHRAREKV